MNGRATAHAAISIVNALPLGVGAAVGIEWPARASATVTPGPAPRARAVIAPASSRTPLVREAARRALDTYGRGGQGRLRLVLRSTIPVARGLKSSSAVSTSVTLATARALGCEPAAVEVARLAAETGRATGLSATGAYDDALAGLLPGGVVTDNRLDRPLRRLDLGGDLAVALWIPTTPHPSSAAVQRRFRRHASLAEAAVDAALRGDWTQAMTANSALVEASMGYRYTGLHSAVARAGAVASGVSGMGPTFAAVAPLDRIGRVVRALPRDGGRRRSVRLFGAPADRRAP